MTLCLASCASISGGRTEVVNFVTTPPGAKITVVEGKSIDLSCIAPCKLKVDRREESTFEITLTGYTSVKRYLSASIVQSDTANISLLIKKSSSLPHVPPFNPYAEYKHKATEENHIFVLLLVDRRGLPKSRASSF